MAYLLKFIFITLIVLWLIKGLLRLLFPVILKNLFSNIQNQGAAQPSRKKPEGAISIDHIPEKEKKGNADKLGDFVDYEEIK